MASDILVSISADTRTFINTTKGQGASLSFSGASAGTFTVQKGLPDGTFINVTDENGVAVAITTLPTTINLFLGAGTDIYILPSGIAGTLKVTSNPLKSDK